MNFIVDNSLEQTVHATPTDSQDECLRRISAEKAAEFVARKAQEEKP